jgi:hypothetical protein
MEPCEDRLCAAMTPGRTAFFPIRQDAVTSVSLVLANLATPERVRCAFQTSVR